MGFLDNRHVARRGIIDVQFNWIFILIAGFVMLLFIISIIMSQKASSDKQAAFSAVSQIQTIIQGRQVSGNVYSEISIPATTTDFTCDKYTNLSNFKISNSERVQLPNEIIFAPQEFTTNTIDVWSLEFDAPFPVNTFLYVTAPRSIILVYNTPATSALASAFYDGLPGNITKAYINSTSINDYNDFAVRKIVCFNSICPASTSASYVNITPASSSSGLDYGNVTFHSESSPDTTLPYITSASLYGAIFSDNADYYYCEMSRAMSQYNLKNKLVTTRLGMIEQNLALASNCQVSIDIALTNIYHYSALSFNQGDVSRLYQSIGYISLMNNDLLIGSCPTIY